MDSTYSKWLCKQWNPQYREGQKRKFPTDNSHLDSQRYSLYLKEFSISSQVKKLRSQESCVPWIPWTFSNNYITFKNLQLNSIKTSLLQELFKKFLHFRCPSHSSTGNDDAAFILGALVSMLGKKGQDFEPDSLWTLMTSPPVLQSQETFDSAVSELLTRNGQRSISFKPRTIGMFGEFLYHISTVHTDSDSPLAQIRKFATEGECLLIDEIAMKISPKFAILSFIAIRNIVASILPELDMIDCNRRLWNFSRRVFPVVHKSYRSKMKILREIPELSDYFSRFQHYLCTDLNVSANRFGTQSFGVELEEVKYFEDETEYFTDRSFHRGKTGSLVQILMNAANIFLYVHRKEFEKCGSFGYNLLWTLPKYLEIYKIPRNLPKDKPMLFKKKGVYHTVEAVLLTVSLLLDFLFVENWQGDLLCDYLKICKELKVTLEAKSDVMLEIAKKASLFPFM